MEEKIPYEVLLPVALAIYQSVPRPLTSKLPKEDEYALLLEKNSTSFATFYHDLHRKLLTLEKP
ncbi:MAG: hypothetical protein IJU76_05885 [Desulfovibrionaceae bacterium]|nr:hypothetical protein [Desulfovibrionaceae bacterium]